MQDYRFQIDWAKHWTLLWIRHRTLHGANFVEVSYAWRFTTFVAWVHDDTYDRWAVERSHVCSQRQAFRWSPTVILDFLNTMYGAVIVSTLELYVPRFTISKVLRNRMNPCFCKSWCTIGFAMHTLICYTTTVDNLDGVILVCRQNIETTHISHARKFCVLITRLEFMFYFIFPHRYNCCLHSLLILSSV